MERQRAQAAAAGGGEQRQLQDLLVKVHGDVGPQLVREVLQQLANVTGRREKEKEEDEEETAVKTQACAKRFSFYSLDCLESVQTAASRQEVYLHSSKVISLP